MNPTQRRASLLAVLLIAALTLAGCTSSKQSAAPTPTPSASPTNPYGAAPVDPPGPNDVVLTIAKGKVSKTFTMKELLALGTTETTLFEPFVKSRQTFSTIPMSKLFDLVGMKPSDKLVTKALNDYVFTEEVSKFLKANALLAVKRFGTDIPFDQGGPIRIVFADGSTWSAFLDAWNWSLSSLTVN